MPRVVIRRTGNARIRRAAIDGVQLVWRSDDPSRTRPKKLPAGEHLFSWFVEGSQNQTYGFFFQDPVGVPCVVNPAGPLDQDNARDWGVCPFVLA